MINTSLPLLVFTHRDDLDCAACTQFCEMQTWYLGWDRGHQLLALDRTCATKAGRIVQLLFAIIPPRPW